jgi:multiple sugar transport system substrate-binding protein
MNQMFSTKRPGAQFWRKLAFIALIAVMVSACTPAAATPAANQAQPTPNTAASSGEKVTLNLWIFEGEEGFLPKLKEGFEKKYPNITLEITEIPESDYVTKIDTALAAGATPDIAFIYEPRWVKAGKFLAIDDIVSKYSINVADFNQGIVKNSCTMNGKLYCLGTYTGAVLLFYNKDMFDAAGLSYPSPTVPMTIDEYEAAAAKLYKPNDDIKQRVYGGSSGISFWWMDPATRFSPDGRKIEGYLNDDATIHSYEVLADMVKQGYSPSEADSSLLGDQDLVATKQMGMEIIDNIVAIKQLEDAGINWGAAPVPVEKKGDQPWVAVWTDSMGVFTQSKHPQEALEFIAYMATDGNALRVDFGSYPLNNKVALEKNWAGNSQGRKEAMQAIGLARGTVWVPSFWDHGEGDAFGYMVDGSKTAKQALDDAAKGAQEELDKAWEAWDNIK